MGRNMFGPVRGSWPDESWRGWWGENPVYHTQVFVLTHHPRAPLEMEGGTTFHFVTDGIRVALERARDAANGKDVRIGGGAATIRQYLRERLIGELHIAISPVLLVRVSCYLKVSTSQIWDTHAPSMSQRRRNSHRANSDLNPTSPKQALQRTAAGRRASNRRVAWPPSQSFRGGTPT